MPQLVDPLSSPVAFGSQPLDVFLRQLAFTDAAPRRLQKAALEGDVSAFGRALRRGWPLKGIDPPRRPARPGRIRPPKQSPIAISRPALVDGLLPLTERERLLWDWWTRFAVPDPDSAGALAAGSNGRLRHPSGNESPLLDWLDRVRTSGTPLTISELLAAFDLLARNGPTLPDDELAELWRAALAGMQALVASDDEASFPAERPDLQLIALGELPWKAGIFFTALEGMDELANRGRAVLTEGLTRLTDAAGLPSGPFALRLARMAAPLLRATTCGAASGRPLWTDDAAPRFQGLLKATAALTRRDGRAALDGATDDGAAAVALLAQACAAQLPTKSRPRLLAEALRDGAPPLARPSSRNRRRMAEVLNPKKRPSFQSDATLVACLRCDWTPFSDLLAVAHDRPRPRIELAALGETILAGEWSLALEIEGRPLALANAWQPTCWFSDADADYLEIQMQLEGGLRIERQMLLARREHFVLLADCVSGSEGRIECRSQLPLAAGVSVEKDSATRECRLTIPTDRKPIPVRAFPLALEDDRLRSAAGSLQPIDGGLELRQSGSKGLFAPLVLDWHPDRRRHPADWRRLTVAEQGKPLPGDAASGHRLRIGSHQVLVYRSLRNSGELRSVLGYHTPHETMIGVFDSDGDVEPLLLVE